MSHWDNDNFNPEDHFGFVYCITNKIDGRKYIGQKYLFFTIKKPPLKGKKRKRRVSIESDWRTYTGSSKSLNEDIATLGKANFEFTILSFHNCRWDLSYAETKQIIIRDAIPSESYYNGFIGRIGAAPKGSRIS